MQGPRLNAERDVGSITSESETLPEEKDGECFHKGDLAGTAGPYDRSVFLCFKNADAWLPHVEEDDPPKVVSTALKTHKDNITVKYSCMICVEKQEEKNQPGLGELLEKAEKQRWMLIASVAFGWGRVEVTMCSNIIREVGAERCMIHVEKQEEKKLPSLREPLEKAEKQWWMLIASVAFGWGEGDVTIYSNNKNGNQNGTGNNENGKASMYV
ncbi:hypothetical protein NC653_018810 [Populus alba x Populus x berolinensis]|uniref:Uncharacterized protein n=1 Tax=Populus alba x Populus x berolinensis TaxID=444605 RepID=A0AAD6VW33_9ROSI|nr:hypothetical protein NC653_018810 [Populus alba x Populus x berolinensis]